MERARACLGTKPASVRKMVRVDVRKQQLWNTLRPLVHWPNNLRFLGMQAYLMMCKAPVGAKVSWIHRRSNTRVVRGDASVVTATERGRSVIGTVSLGVGGSR